MAHWVTKKDNSSYKSVFWGSFFGFMLACIIFPYFGIVFGLIGVFSTIYSSPIKNNLNKKGVLYSLIPSCLLQLIWIIIISNLFGKLQNKIILIIFFLILISLIIIITYINKKGIVPPEEDW